MEKPQSRTGSGGKPKAEYFIQILVRYPLTIISKGYFQAPVAALAESNIKVLCLCPNGIT